MACGARSAQQSILAVFEPRSNTMKLGAMKAQLPWSLEQADLSFCHTGGLGWNAAEVLAPMGDKARVAATSTSWCARCPRRPAQATTSCA